MTNITWAPQEVHMPSYHEAKLKAAVRAQLEPLNLYVYDTGEGSDTIRRKMPWYRPDEHVCSIYVTPTDVHLTVRGDRDVSEIARACKFLDCKVRIERVG